MSMGMRPWKRFWLTGGVLALFMMLFLDPDTAAGAISGAMEQFCTKLVPVLFPYMVLSHFFCTYGLLDPLSALLPLGRWFSMDRAAFSIFVMGHLCGYPVGAKMAGEMVRQGKLGVRQAAVLCGISSGASPAFLIHVVGRYLWNDIRFGIGFLLLQVLCGILAGVIFGRRAGGTESVPGKPAAEEIPFVRCFCEAVGGSALQMVSIGGYIVFFAMTAALLPGGSRFSAAAAAVLEFSTGARLSAGLGGLTGAFLTGFAVGFGGLSVLAQIGHMTAGSGISLRWYVLYKLALGGICGVYGLLYFCIHPEMELERNVAVMEREPDGVYLVLFFAFLAAAGCMVRYKHFRKNGGFG